MSGIWLQCFYMRSAFLNWRKVAWLGAALSSQNSPCGCFSSVVEHRCCWRPAALPSFLWSPPCPSALLKCPVPGRKPGEGWTVSRGSCAPSRQPSGLSGLTGQGPVSPLFEFTDSRYVFRFFLHRGTHTAQVSWSSSSSLGSWVPCPASTPCSSTFYFTPLWAACCRYRLKFKESYPLTQPGPG